MAKLSKNDFYDISKLPKGYGLIVFPISISRIDHDKGQSPKQCLEYIEYFSPNKISEPKVGLNIIYGDSLYMNSLEPATLLKNKHTSMILRHKSGFQNLVNKNWEKFQIQNAFSFEVWNQLLLNYKRASFENDFELFKNSYKNDTYFQKLIVEDSVFCDRELTNEQESFFLEEFFIQYLLINKQIVLPNEYVQGREEWVLVAYPGPQLKGQIYTCQKNYLNFDAGGNQYQNCIYDLESKKLIDFTRVDLETYNYKYEN